MSVQRFVPVVMAIAAALPTGVSPPAGAQLGNPGWGDDVEVDESAGEVVLTLEFGGTGNVKYRTIDEVARAPEDYLAVTGEVVFTHPGSRTIRIPIVDDDLAEGPDETFTVHAVEEPNPDPWPYAGDTVTVRIIDDDGATAGVPPSTAAMPSGRDSEGAPAGSPPPPDVARADDAETTTTEVRARTAEVREGALPEIRPRSGFELTSDAGPEVRRPPGSGGGTTVLAFGSGTAAVGAGALALARRRRQWSPTRS